jgi:hypothetical protein
LLIVDKAKVEAGVLLVERWILAALRKRKFFTLGELNQAIADLLVRLNDRPFRKRQGCRRSLFESLDQPALRVLPTERYQYGDWETHRVYAAGSLRYQFDRGRACVRSIPLINIASSSGRIDTLRTSFASGQQNRPRSRRL